MNTHRIGDAAKATGLTASAIRFYEARGLLPPAARSHSGYRQYDDADLRRLRLVRNARALGIPLDEVRQLLDGIPSSTCGDYAGSVLAVIERQQRAIDEQIAALEATRDRLDALASEAIVATGSAQRVEECPCCLLLEDGDAASGYCEPAGQGFDGRLTAGVREVLQCDIDARPDAPTPDDLVPYLTGGAIEAGALVLRFVPAARSMVEQFAAAECVCCGAMDWAVRDAGRAIVLAVAGTPAQLEALASMWPLSERLS